MGIRDDMKQETREKIIQSTSKVYFENGFNKLSTKVISRESGVSQGSIFLHFGTKDNLLLTILESNITEFENDLVERCIPSETQDTFIKEFLFVFSKHENSLSRIYKDQFNLPDSVQKQIESTETILKNLFFDNVKLNRSNNVNILDSFILIDAFFSQMKSYLMEKTVYSVSNSVIRQKRGRIMKLYRMLFVS